MALQKMNNYLDKIFSLKDKTAIITGGSKGIGLGILSSFIKAGANVICISRTKPSDLKIQNFKHFQCDISDFNNFEKIFKEIFDIYGNIDILVNAAGISIPSRENFDELDRFNRTLSVNLASTYHCCEIVSEHMSQNSSIINITSIGSMLGFPKNPGYTASKGGVMALTKSLAIDFSSKKIRVNNIVPGYIKTDMTKKSFDDERLFNERLSRMIIKRWGTVEDIANAAIFLASDASSYINGSDLVVDGGWTAKGI